jgi:hypothetical protein
MLLVFKQSIDCLKTHLKIRKNLLTIWKILARLATKEIFKLNITHLYATNKFKIYSFNSHVLSPLLAFILSQDQTQLYSMIEL